MAKLMAMRIYYSVYLEEGSKGSQKLGQLVAKMHSHQQSEGKFGFELPYEGLMSHLIIHGQSLGVKFS